MKTYFSGATHLGCGHVGVGVNLLQMSVVVGAVCARYPLADL